jgi:LPXTG-motif cell wall-anchored protein
MIAGGVLLSPGILVLAVDHSTGYTVAGTIIVAGAVGLLGSGAWFYARRTRERRAIDREIEQLERARASRAASSWGLAFDLGERKGVRVSWRY